MLDSIRKYNFRPHLRDHFNHLRTFALGDEAALLMASYPRGNRPQRPFPYYNEVMTGFEYTAAVGMLQEGRSEAGLECIAAIRDRYDGRRRNPFDEAECGHHYARALASWAAILTLSGFSYSALNGEMCFACAGQEAKWLWSNGDAWGTLHQTPNGSGIDFSLHVHAGELHLKVLCIGEGSFSFDGGTLRARQSIEGRIEVGAS
jgi:hypothetical protein